MWHVCYVVSLWISYRELTFEHALPRSGQTISLDCLYPRSISHVLFNAMSGEFLGAYPVGFNRELDQVASSTLRNFRQTLFLEHVSRVFSEVHFRLFYLLCDTALWTITAK